MMEFAFDNWMCQFNNIEHTANMTIMIENKPYGTELLVASSDDSK